MVKSGQKTILKEDAIPTITFKTQTNKILGTNLTFPGKFNANTLEIIGKDCCHVTSTPTITDQQIVCPNMNQSTCYFKTRHGDVDLNSPLAIQKLKDVIILQEM